MSDKLYASNFEMPDGRIVYVQDEETANKVDKVAGMGLSQNSFTDAEKTKLAGIASGAEVNAIATVQKNGTALPINNKTVNVTVPTAVSQLTNDSDFASKKYAISDTMKLNGRKFIFIGDSYGDGYTPDGSIEGWCDRVKTYLGLTLGTNYWTNHAGGACFGRSDNTSFESLLANVNVPTAEKANITDIVIGGGYNDASWSVESVNDGMDRVDTLVKAQYPNATVWVIAMGWGLNRNQRLNLVTRYDEAYSRTCHAKRWKYRKLYPQLHYKPYFSSDGIHPNANGMYLIANCTAGFLMDSDIETNTAEQGFYYNGNMVGLAMRCGDIVLLRTIAFNHTVNKEISANSLTDLDATIICPYIFGDITGFWNFALPAIVQHASTGFYSANMSFDFRQVDGAIKLYGQTNLLTRDGQNYLSGKIVGIQYKPGCVAIPIQYA